MNITKSAPLPERPCEQLTCCEKNGSVQGNYINRVAKRHNCRITGKTKATTKGSPVGTRENKSITNNATFAAGGQCNQSGSVRCHTCNERFSLYSLRNCSRAKAHGANLSDSCSIFLRRLFRAGDNVLVNSLSVIVLSCIAMRRSYSHHGADSNYSDSLALRRWRRLISPRMAVTINCASVSFSSLTKFISLKTSRGILAVFCCDLLLVVPVGITGLLTVRWRSVYVEKKIKKGLKCKSPKSSIIFKGDLHLKNKAPQVSLPLAGLLTTNDNESIEAAMRNYTRHPQGRDSYNLNKYIWRFIALSTAQPRVITIEATSEQEARQQSPAGCVMVFAARIRQGVRHA
ncbi:host cell division inhibitor Icd-like protein [Escherichia coli]|nr:host cell division inhibitor Icd-like protein [Escherichia coli]EHJ8060538.1 host cell division inhibitor Icd-like protein [Escherichia coli]EHX8749666.1 host cell division inhibitor Icd-like protein [Escherichia coli]EIA9882325.1 host cell division inhibitor Icd-like protein [Escherichia coli]EID6995955.1 host cell division inhibitor Icd-like protein [Escherichia coli]